MILSRHCMHQTELAVKVIFLVKQNMTVKWLRNKIVCFTKIWKPPRQHFGFFEDWRNFGSVQKLSSELVFVTGVALIL